MKRFVLTCLFALTIAASAGLPSDRIETGSLTTKHGIHVLVTYVVLKDAYHEVHLFWPDGHETVIAVEPGISAQTLDRSLQRFVDVQ